MLKKVKFPGINEKNAKAVQKAAISLSGNPFFDISFVNMEKGKEYFLNEAQYDSLMTYQQETVDLGGGKKLVRNVKKLSPAFQVVANETNAVLVKSGVITIADLTPVVVKGVTTYEATQVVPVAEAIGIYDVAFDKTGASIVSQADGTFTVKYVAATDEAAAAANVVINFAILK